MTQMANTRTRIKICGFTRAEDIETAVSLGADAVGFVFYPPSKRYVTPDRARELRERVPAFVTAVALFVDPTEAEVESVLRAAKPGLLQFHGDESPQYCESFGVPYLKAFRIGAPGLDSAEGVAQTCAQYERADGWLFDSYSQGYGGSGQAFDHRLLGGLTGIPCRPVIVSGGLKPESVEGVVRMLRPWAVDVSSAVESAPGVKSPQRMREFIDAVRRADEPL